MTDFGVAMARLLLFSTYQLHLYARAHDAAADATLPASRPRRSRRSRTTSTTPRHWVLRLGDGTDESHARMQAALDAEWPYVDELFAPRRRRRWPVASSTRPTLRDAVLSDVSPRGRRGDARPCPRSRRPSAAAASGLHTEHLGYLLAEMQHLHRSHPGATW